MAKPPYNVYSARCPTRQALDRIADKWTALIVGLLSERTHRFGELQRGVEGISHKVLSQTLQSLERDGEKRVQPSPPNNLERTNSVICASLSGSHGARRAPKPQHFK
jgi:DNA-binding HxlR family transcriptional regulator